MICTTNLRDLVDGRAKSGHERAWSGA